MSLFIKLFLAHIIGDFILQFDTWVKHKQKYKIRSPFLYFHIGLHFMLILLITWDWTLWGMALLIAGTHFFIDLAKIYITAKTDKKQWPFFVDQLLHLAVLVVVAFYGNGQELFETLTLYFDWRIITAYVLLSVPTGVFIEKCLMGWSFSQSENASLPKAGKVIGIIERILVLTFILLNHWEAIGFLITAKSVFRFNDLKVSDRKMTEYILIGTLLSFGVAILVGVLAYGVI